MTGRLPVSIRLLFVLIPLMTALWALWLGQDASWDLRNYHFYNPFSFLFGRMGFDVAVAQVANYYNPLFHVPFYYAVTALPPKAVAFILGFVPGLNLFFLYAIAKKVVHFEEKHRRYWFYLAVAIVGLVGAGTISELGTSFGDNILSLPIFLAIWMIVITIGRLETPGMGGAVVVSMAAGVVVGATVGLKQPFALYAVGICVAFFGFSLPFKTRFFLAFIFGVGVLVGMALTGGFWMAEMWTRFGNPLFPYFNQYFQSPWAASDAYRDIRFIPKTLFEWLFFPAIFTWNPLAVGEVPFRDLRFGVLYLLLWAWPAVWLYRGLRGHDHGVPSSRFLVDHRGIGRFVAVFFGVSFILWMKLFAIYRYLVVCEMLAPLVIVLVLKNLTASRRAWVGWSLGGFLLILVTLSPGNWGRRPFGDDYFGVEVPPISHPANTMVLVTGHEPMAYMIPFFPAQVRFLRVHGYLTGPSDTPNAMDRQMAEDIAGHEGDLFLMYRSFEEWTALETIKHMGFGLERDRCLELLSHVEPIREHPYYFCPIKRDEPS